MALSPANPVSFDEIGRHLDLLSYKETIMVGFSYILPSGLTDPVRSLTAFTVHEGEPSDSFAALAQRLTDTGCSALPIRMPDGRLGIVTERASCGRLLSTQLI